MAKANSIFFLAEPFLEAIPQCHVLFTIFLSSGGPAGNKYNQGAVGGKLFIATFVTSILSATFGMTKLLKVLKTH
jgi:hypothetical protein